jgi:hypothetical protein
MSNIYVSNQEAVDINVHENYKNTNKGNVNLTTEETHTKKVSVDFDIVPDTLRLVPDDAQSNKFYLEFKYSAKVPCVLTIFLCAKVAVNRETNMITGIFPKHPDDVKFMDCQVGENQTLPNKFCPIELFKYQLNEIFETVNQHVPVIIVLKRKDQALPN